MAVARKSGWLRGALALGFFLMLTLCVALTATAAEAPEFEYVKRFGPDGTESSAFGQVGPIAVDQVTHNVYVLDHANGALLKFDGEGQPVPFGGSAPYITGNKISGLTFFAGFGESQVAVDSATHKIYVTSANSIRAFDQEGEPALFSAGPGAGTSSIGGFGKLLGVAVDSNGAIYAGDKTGSLVKIYASSGAFLTQFASAEAANLAVDTNGHVYVNKAAATVLRYTPSAFPVTAATTYTPASSPLSPEAAATVTVDLATNDVYVAHVIPGNPRIAVYDQAGTPLTSFAGAGEEGEVGTAEGIGIDSSALRIFIGPSKGLSQVEVFLPKPPGEPIIDAVSATDVTNDSATLNARINPNLATTEYHFEYGTGDCKTVSCVSVPASPVSIGDGHEVVAVSQAINGLTSNTTYHYRVVAHNSLGTTEAAGIFTTQSIGIGFELSDGRVWEMVSPPNKHGGVLTGSFGGHIQASSDGEAISYLSVGSIEAEPAGNRAGEQSSVLARRGGGGAWQSKDITPPNSRVVPLGNGFEGEYHLFSPDLSQAILEPRDGTLLSPQASERTPYLRENSEPPVYTPLVTGKEGFANVPPGTEFGGGTNPIPDVRLRGASTDLAHIVLRASVPLTPQAPDGPLDRSLYEWSAGSLEPVNVLPADEGGEMVSATKFGSAATSVRKAISDDGSRVFWTADASKGLYVRDTSRDESGRLDLKLSGPPGTGAVNPVFQGANADGTIVFFTDSQRLTEDASPAGRDLYRCEIPQGAMPPVCATLTDISAPEDGSGESSEVQALIPGMSDDGGTVYFVAKGVLDDGLNQFGKGAVSGEPNLYLWNGGETRFIYTLSPQDDADWGQAGTAPGNASSLSAASSPSGRYLAFMSQRDLEGISNLDPASGEPVEEIFNYDSQEDRLFCVSCHPTGAASEGVLESSQLPLVDPQGQWAGYRIASILPEPTLLEAGGISLYRPRAVLDNGRVFFNSLNGLVPSDSNGSWDVYQYEPEGTGGCTPASDGAATTIVGPGCVSLMSSGSGEGETGFLDASASGDDVFFLTHERLSVMDEDDQLDVYDARVHGVAAVKVEASPCNGELCQPPAAPPADQAPSSATFNGAGNQKVRPPKRCPRGKRKARRHGKTVCVKRKARRHHKHSRKHPNNTGRAGS